MDIDRLSMDIVERLRPDIRYSAIFTKEELAHFLVEIVVGWYQCRRDTNYRFPFTAASDALKHAQEVLDAVSP